MRKAMAESVAIPQGVSCIYEQERSTLVCSKDSVRVQRHLHLPGVLIKVVSDQITFSSPKGNKNQYKEIKSAVAHVNNLFKGLDQKYTYTLEACNVHFPMTLKVEGNQLVINNFLGEKVSRKARILSGVDVEVKGAKITVSGHDLEATGQTAANIERATVVRNRDRRIFQDGIYITDRPGGMA